MADDSPWKWEKVLNGRVGELYYSPNVVEEGVIRMDSGGNLSAFGWVTCS